jgi:hypothetical protein
MKKTLVASLGVILVAMVLAACGGGLRFSERAEDARGFHPKGIVVLPVDAGAYGQAKDEANAVLAQILSEKRWFDRILAGKEMADRLAADETFRKAVTDYTNKLQTVNFSDPALSQAIGKAAQAEALLTATIESWFYTKEIDKNIAKGGFAVQVIEAETGKTMWRAAHHLDESYTLFQPSLTDVARKLVHQILNDMPH